MRNRLNRAHINQGFTLVELIIVIVIISILAIVALPRFVGFEEQAEIAVLEGALGTLRSTARIAESVGHAEGFKGNGTVEINNRTVLFTNGFPVARDNDIGPTGPGSFEGILSLIELDGGIEVFFSDSTQILNSIAIANDFLILEVNGKCVFYRPPQTAGELPDYSNGVLTFDAATQTCS